MLNPEESQPGKFEGLKGPHIRRDEKVLDVRTVPRTDQSGRAQFILDALPLVEQQRWDLFTIASRRFLVSTGLMVTSPETWAHELTVPSKEFQALVGTLTGEAKLLAARALLLLTEDFGFQAAGPAVFHLRQIAEWFRENSVAPENAITSAYRKLVLALIEERNLGTASFRDGSVEEVLGRRLSIVKLNSTLLKYLGAKDRAEKTEARDYLYKEGRHNDLPFLDNPRFEADRREVKDKAVSTALRCFKYTFNFDRLSGETRRAASELESLITRFGVDCFEDCRAMFGSSIDRTPGRGGRYLSNPRMEQLFFQKLTRDGSYARSYENYGEALAQFESSTFVFLRGAILVYNPSDDYLLPVGPASPSQHYEKYALFLANDHFTGGYELAALLPIKVLYRYIMPSLQDLNPAPDEALPVDISVPGFNLASLVDACERAQLPAIMLGNLSTVFGGNVAGYPKGSEPFYWWEPARERASNIWRDALGRVHHAWYVRGEDSPPPGVVRTEHFINVLRPLGQACHQVADVATGLLNILDLFMVRYDAWKCDLAPSQGSIPRMLAEAYTWHTELHKRKASSAEFPLVCLADRYDWSKPAEVVLDTETLEMHLGDGRRYALPQHSRGEGTAELSAWSKYIVPRIAARKGKRGFAESDKTLILLPREYVHSSQSNAPLPKIQED